MTTLSKEELLRFWLLTSAIDHPVGLTCLFPRFDWDTLNASGFPGCAASDYARELLALFALEWIDFDSNVAEDNVRTHAGVKKLLDRFVEFSVQHQDANFERKNGGSPGNSLSPHRPDLKVEFKLTESGGAAWERIAQPNWAKFFEEFTDYEGIGPEPTSAEILSQDLNLVLARLGWFRRDTDESLEYGPQVDTIDLQFHDFYEVLYWKRLPSVYRATFDLTPVPPLWTIEPDGEPGNAQEPAWFKDWHDAPHRWFTQPCDLPGWTVSSGNRLQTARG